jgi:hypothetical protein
MGVPFVSFVFSPLPTRKNYSSVMGVPFVSFVFSPLPTRKKYSVEAYLQMAGDKW